MRISAKAEYACIAMYELALTRPEAPPARVKTIADHHGISPRFLVHILLQLKNAGLVVSSRGAAGGYHLARAPEQISLADIIHAVDFPSAHPHASRSSGRAQRNNGPQRSPIQQALRDAWDEIEKQEELFLRRVTLADLVRQAQDSGVASYQI
jgi:Rrf2 family cysteine metabolism transcriptional repressor